MESYQYPSKCLELSNNKPPSFLLLPSIFRLLFLNDLFHFLNQRIGKVFFGKFFYDVSIFEQETNTFAAGDPCISLARFSGPVHHAAHDRDRDGLLDMRQPLLDLVRQADDVDLGPAAGGQEMMFTPCWRTLRDFMIS